MLKQRVITALILLPITLAILFFASSLWFALLTGIVLLYAGWEWSALMEVNIFWRIAYLVSIVVIGILTLFISVTFIFNVAFVWWLIALLLISFYPHGGYLWRASFIRAVMGVLVLIPCWAALIFIRSQDDGIDILLFIFILVWGADTSAYFVGRKWGAHKLLPLVSPGKTVQGLIGAIIFAIIASIVALLWSGTPSSIWIWGILLSLVTVLFSIVGDLLESMVKREAHVKDSGQLLPGHGGLLDRIDSLTAAAPIFALGAISLGHNLS